MKKLLASTAGLAAVLLLAWAASGADQYAAPRTAWGDPDLQGQWNSQTSTPLPRTRSRSSASDVVDCSPPCSRSASASSDSLSP